MAAPEDALRALGLSLPPVPQAAGAYAPARRAGPLMFVAGQIARVDGKVLHPGRLGEGVTLEQGREAAARCVLQALAILKEALGSLDAIGGIVRVDGFVAAAPSFADHPKVVDGASELLQKVLGEKGRHARLAVGAASLPLGACVEIALVAEASG